MPFQHRVMISLTSMAVIANTILAIPQSIDQIQTPLDAAYWIAKDERNAGDRIQQLNQIGTEYGRRGDLTSVNQIADLIRRQSPTSVMIKVSGDFAVSLLGDTNNQEALAYIKGLQDTNEKNATIETLAAELIRRNQLYDALEAAQLLSNTARRNRLLLDVGIAFANSGRTESAVIAMNLITDNSKDDGLYAIAAAHAERQELSKSIEVAQSITDTTRQQKAQVKLLSERAKANDLEGMQAAIKQLGSPSAQQRVLQYVAQAYVSNNRFNDAQAILDTITFIDIREAILAAMAIQYATNREFELSEKTLNQITRSNRGAAAFGVAKAMTQDDNVDRAFELINQLEPGDRAAYLPKLAAEFGKSPQILFTQLIVKQIEPMSLQQEAMAQFLTSLAASSTSPTKVIRYAREVSDPTVRDRALVSIATIYLNKKNIDASVDAIQSIQSPSLRIEWDCKLAAQLPVADGVTRLQRIESSLANWSAPLRIVALTQIAIGYRRLGQSEQASQVMNRALSIATTVPDLAIEFRLKLVDAYAQIGLPNAAIQAIRTINQNNAKVTALLMIPPSPTSDETRSAIREIAQGIK